MAQTQKSCLLGASLLVLAGLLAMPARAAVTVVSPDDLNGWVFSNTDNAGTNASGGFEVGPATPPLGIGSAEFIVGDSTSSEILGTGINIALGSGSFQALSYSTYVTTSTLGSGSAPTLQFNLFNGTTFEGRLVFDPGLLLTVVDGAWQTWDATAATAWYFSNNSHNTLSSDCSISSSSKYCTLAQAEAFLDGMGISATAVLFKAGSGQSSFDGNVDDLHIATATSDSTYNFEPVPEPGSLAILGTALLGFSWLRRRRSV